MTRLVIIGAGGFGREVFSIVQAINAVEAKFDVIGVLDDRLSQRNSDELRELDAAFIGPLDWLETADIDVEAVVGIGSSEIRASIVQRFPGRKWATLVHPDSSIGLHVRLGAGSIVAAGARLSTAISIGRHCQIDQAATLGHDCNLGDFSRLNPQACVSGNVSVGTGAIIGANATIIQGLNIGENSLVGAGSVVTRDIPPNTTVKGVPAK